MVGGLSKVAAINACIGPNEKADLCETKAHVTGRRGKTRGQLRGKPCLGASWRTVVLLGRQSTQVKGLERAGLAANGYYRQWLARGEYGPILGPSLSDRMPRRGIL